LMSLAWKVLIPLALVNLVAVMMVMELKRVTGVHGLEWLLLASVVLYAVQGIYSADHAKAADVPIVVAVNKIDREEADPNRVLQQLSEHGLVPESWGGDTITVEVSALQNLGIEDLLEQIVLVAEIEELQASPEGRARGVVIEAELEIGRGPVASVIVERGTLRVGDPIVAGAAWGKVKALVDEHGDQIKEAPPSTPVQVLGFSEPPEAGDEFRVAPELAQARTIGEARAHRYRVAGHVPAATSALGGAKLEDLFEQIQRGLMAPEDEWVYMHRGLDIPDRIKSHADGSITAPAPTRPMIGTVFNWRYSIIGKISEALIRRSPDKISETAPGRTPIAWARPPLLLPVFSSPRSIIAASSMTGFPSFFRIGAIIHLPIIGNQV